MKKIINWLLVSAFFIIAAGCSSGKGGQLTPAMEGKLYTQVNMWTEKDQILATNYQRGAFIPVNSEVSIVSYSSKVIKFKIVGSEQVISLINVPKHTNLTIDQIFNQTFSKTKLNMNSFSAKAKKAILSGRLETGMTKAEVIAARGYPPQIGTFSLDSNTWKYWQNRFVTRDVNFDKGKVTGLVGWGTGNN